MSIMISGTSGFLGQAFTQKMLEKGEKVYSLARHLVPEQKNLIPLIGDILETDLGLTYIPKDIESIYHLAANHRLDEKNASEIWETNVLGTANAISLAEKYNIPKLYFVSSSYTFARNTYEKSKMLCETMVMNSRIPHKTIFKPSIIMPTEKQIYSDHLLQLAQMIVRIHKGAETMRRYVESGLRLPGLRPVFHIPGNPDGKLNLININDVAAAMAEIDSDGVYWLTNPDPPYLKDVAEWVGEVTLIDLKIVPEFKEMPLETIFQRMGKAFLPYLWGDNFQSSIKCHPITREYIHKVVINSVLGEEKV